MSKRKKSDRRSWGPMPEVPFIDSEGEVVIEDRRKIPDRRIHNINVEFDDDPSPSDEGTGAESESRDPSKTG
jgi:hypothetical protein